MSSDPDRWSIPVFHADQQQALRLIELPHEILGALILKEDQLVLKAPDADVAGETVLCSSQKTWAIRQIQSSNALMVLSQNEQLALPEAPASLTVTAHCSGTIEVLKLEEASAKNRTARAWLVGVLSVYEGVDSIGAQAGVAQRDVFRQIPLSDGEISEAWIDLAGFEFAGRSFLPSATLTLKIWQAMMTDAEDLAVDLTKPFASEDLLCRTTAAESEYPPAARGALLRKLSTRMDGQEERLILQSEVVITHIGQAAAAEGWKSETDLGQRLRKLLPPLWHDNISSERVHLLYSTYLASSKRNGQSTGIATDLRPDQKGKTVVRNWHEKFKRNR